MRRFVQYRGSLAARIEEAMVEKSGSEDRVDEGRPPLRTAGQHASDGSVQRGSGRRRGGDAAHWRDLPQDAQAALIGLMTQLMLDHARGHRWPEASQISDKIRPHHLRRGQRNGTVVNFVCERA